MAREISVSLDGVEASFTFKSIDRASLYGKRRRVPIDENGNPCTRATLTNDGALLLRSGMTGQGYFLADGTYLKQSDLEAFSSDGSPLQKVPSSLGTTQPLESIVSPQEVLDLRLSNVYFLTAVADVGELSRRLNSGEIFRLTFNFRDSFQPESAFLLANDAGVFLLVGSPVESDWCSLDSLIDLPTLDEIDDEDLDFEF